MVQVKDQGFQGAQDAILTQTPPYTVLVARGPAVACIQLGVRPVEAQDGQRGGSGDSGRARCADCRDYDVSFGPPRGLAATSLAIQRLVERATQASSLLRDANVARAQSTYVWKEVDAELLWPPPLVSRCIGRWWSALV